ncbi:hypothetical protein BDV23DRAFT_183253 [Aspergillus alliaceus]|uniref:Nucleoside phosphorylase domain-containing protein n=1 Tax=Petromyces alliaceus TaxID=209559 RepID=A0A5N7CA98_PETAA|nr:hypothetical protein BDV23DRAFT_183253 [Aspergillus alliaceus]
MRPSSRDKFAIAIICALTLEAEAVEDLFDETYDRLGECYRKEPGDDNAYVNGRIGKHNVVVCYMPSMGKGSAASVASSLKISYKRIEVALVVGVCGGAPYPSSGGEVFLGDVIISDSVVQYDFGKQYPGSFEKKTGVKDTLGRPNRAIRSILASLQARQSRRDLQNKLLRHLQMLQGLQPDWYRPTSVEDVLFEASYQHKHYSRTSATCLCLDSMSEDICKAAVDSTCTLLGCDLNQVCRHRPSTERNSPRVHIGTVASADTVMKSGEHRDRLVQSEGVVGFDMEGAGVWDNISCIIIKGVCDYADSHKNKAWQAYAAATGAATAKAFLEYWEPTAREETNKFHIPLDLSAVPAIEEFIGREDDLNRLWDYLQPRSPPTRKVAVLHGLGGIGKTQLAIHFARKHKVDFSAIFWLSGKDRSALVSSLSSCLSRIQGQPADLKATNEEEAEQRANQVLQWLAMPGNTRWLIIFDNIDHYSPLQGHGDCGYDIYEFFPKADHGSIIITSRLQGLTELGKSFPVQKLMHKDAIQLLLQSSTFSAEDIARTGAEQDIIDLASLLDGLSLAIVIAGAFMRQTGTNFKEYTELYRTSWFNLQSQSGPTRHYQQGNMIQTWMITYQEIQKRDPIAAKLLLFLAFFDNQDIWYELIHSGMDYSDPPAWFKTAVSTKLVFKTKLRVLIKFSLVETGQQEGSYTLHPVVQDWCTHIAASKDLTNQLHGLALISVGFMVPSSSNRRYAEFQQRLLPHANYLTGRERAHWPNDMIDIWDALHGMGNLYSDQGKLKEAEEMYQQALAGKEKALGPDHTSTLGTVNNLGLLYSDQGKLKEAEGMYQRALASYKKALDPDHISTLDTVNNLGNLYNNQGKLKEAENMYQQALAGKEKTLGPDHISTLDTVNNLGNLYNNQGKLKEAEKIYQRALAGYIKALALGPDHTSTLSTVNNLGNLYYNQGKLKEAEEMYQQALAGYKKALGPDHISTLDIINNLGNLYKHQGKLKEAEDMYQQALAGKEKALGPDHISTLGYKKALDPDHTSTLSTVSNLGLLYSDQGKLKVAEKMYQQALAGYKKALGPDHISTLDIINNLGNLYKHQGKLKKAEKIYQQALAGKKKTLDSNHISTLNTVNNLGLLYSNQGKLKEAEDMYQQALAGYKKTLDPDHKFILNTVNNLGNLYYNQGKLKKAEKMYQQALTGKEKTLGPNHISTLGTVNNLSLLYSDQGKLKEAEEMYQRALASYKKALGVTADQYDDIGAISSRILRVRGKRRKC